MSASYRPKRSIPSAVNTPITVRIESSLIINKEEAEAALSDFISVSEAIAGSLPNSLVSDQVLFSNTGLSSSTGSSAILSQLKRVQRDLRGLPPLLSEVVSSTPGTITSAESQNKKIKFDDDDVDVSAEPKIKKIKFDDSEAEGPEDIQMAENVPANAAIDKDLEEEVEGVGDKPQKEHKKSKKEKHDKKDKKEKKHKKDKKEKKDKKDSKE